MELEKKKQLCKLLKQYNASKKTNRRRRSIKEESQGNVNAVMSKIVKILNLEQPHVKLKTSHINKLKNAYLKDLKAGDRPIDSLSPKSQEQLINDLWWPPNPPLYGLRHQYFDQYNDMMDSDEPSGDDRVPLGNLMQVMDDIMSYAW